jgi:hypothetical protein
MTEGSVKAAPSGKPDDGLTRPDRRQAYCGKWAMAASMGCVVLARSPWVHLNNDNFGRFGLFPGEIP